MTLAADPVGAIPREYNFAADILDRNLKAGRANKPAFIDPRGSVDLRPARRPRRAVRRARCARSGVQREERILICLLDTIDWPTAFLGALKAGRGRGAGQHADDRGRLPLHAGRQPRAHAGGVGRALSEVRQADRRMPRPQARRRVRRQRARPEEFRGSDRGRRRPIRRPRRPRATTSRSGSTRRARPASRRARCMFMPICG